MPFAAAGAAVSIGAGLIGSQMQSNAIKSGQSQANAAIQQGVTTATNQLSPWTTTGVPANADQADLLGLNGQDAANAAMAKFQQSPGYAFQLQQGERAVDAGAAASGMLRSGATLKAEQTFGQGLADTDFSNYWNRLQQLSGSGLSAAGGIATAATGGAANIAATDRGAAGAQASIIGNEASSIGIAVNGLMNNQGFQNWLGGPARPPRYAQMPAASLAVGLLMSEFTATISHLPVPEPEHPVQLGGGDHGPADPAEPTRAAAASSSN